MRTSVRWLLPTAGAVAAAIAMAPHAAAAGFFDAEPTSPTVVDAPLTWTFTANGGEQCDLTSDAGVSDSQPCGSGQYAYTPTIPGTYTLTVSDPSTSPATTLATSFPIAVAPAAPTPVRAGGSDTAPTWSFALPAGASATCTASFGGSTVATLDPCSDPFMTDLGAGPYGTYSIAVVVHDNHLDSAPGVAGYDLVPPSPTVVRATPSTFRSNDTSSTFTITDNAAGSGHTFACTVTGPGGYDATVADCAGSTTVDLGSAAADGVYTLHVVETADGVSAPPATAAYRLDRSITPVQVVLTPNGGGRSITGSVTEPDTDGITYTCSVLELPALTPTTCGSSIRVDLPASAPEGTYTVEVTATDGAGNTTSDTAVYTLDVSGPAAAPGATSTATTPGTSRSVTWTLAPTEAGETFTCGSVTPGATAVCSGATVAMTITGNDGTYSVSVTAADSFGNTGAAFALTYVLDTTPPAAPTVATGSAGDTGSGRSRSWSLADDDRGGDLDHYRCPVSVPTSGSAAATCDAATGQVTLTIGAGSPDGSYRVDVYAVDALGNEASTPLVLTYLLDTAAPLAPTVTPVPGPGSTGPTGHSTSPSWSVTDVEPGATVSCAATGPGGTLVASRVSCPGAASLDLTGLVDGTYSLTVTVTDAAGNATSATPVSYLLDTAAPVAPTVTPVPGPGSTGTTGYSTSPTWSVTGVEPGATVTCAASGPGGAVLASKISCAASAVTLNLSGLVDGTYSVAVTVTDAAGNATSAPTVAYVLDTSPPAAPAVTPQPKPGSTGATGYSHGPSWSVTGVEPGAVISCVVVRPDGTGLDPTRVACGPVTTLNLSGLADGSYTLAVTLTDAAGNAGSASPVAYLLDTVGPTPPTVTGEAGAGTTGTTGYSRSPSWSVTDVEPGAAIDCSVVGPGGVLASSAVSCGPTTTLNLAGVADGSYSLTVTLTDAAGNISSADPVTYLLDTHAPAPATVTAVPGPGSTGTTGYSTAPSWSVAGIEPGGTISCAVTRPDGTALAPARESCGATTTLDLAGLGDGTYTLRVTLTDAAGNAVTSAAVTYVLDTAAPAAPTVTPVVGPGSTGTTGYSRVPSWSVTGVEPGATISCAATGPSGALGSGAVSCGSTVGLDLGGLADGTYAVTVTVTDAAGNATSATARSYLLDTFAPGAPTVTAVPGTGSTGTTGFSRTPSWSVADVEPGATISCAASGPAGALTAGAISCGPNATLNLAGLGDGTYSLLVTVTDAAGNATTADPVTYLLDTHPPVAATVTPVAGTGSTGTTGYSATPSWSVSAVEPAAVISCAVSGPGGAVSAALVSCGSTVSVDLTGLGDGSYSVVVTVTDAAGNATDAAAVTYLLDRLPPAAPTTSSATPVTVNVLTWSWTVTDGDARFGRYVCTISGPAGSTASTTCPATGSVTATIAAGSPDGTYVVDVFAVDAAGNVSQTALELDYVLDTAAPVAATVTPVVKPGSTGTTGYSRSPSWTVTGVEPGAVISCTATGPGGVVPAAAVTCGPTVTLDLAGAPEGSYFVTVTLTDAAGNAVSTPAVSYLLDTIAPVAPTLTPIAGAGSSGTTGFSHSPSWTVTNVEPGANLTCAVTGPNGALATSRVSCGSAVSLNLNGQEDGTYVLTVTVTDAAGNTTAAGAASYVLDTVSPPTPSAAGTGSPANTRSPSWSLDDADPTVSYVCGVSGPTGYSAAVDCSSGTSVGVVIAPASPDGRYVVTIDAVDPAGNVDSTPLVIAYVLDTTGPTRPTSSSVSSPLNARQVTWSLTPSEPGETYACIVDGGAVVTCSGSSVDLSLVGSRDATYTVTVTPYDYLGNPGVALTLVYDLDTTGPLAPTSTVVASPGVSRSPSWTLTETETVETYTCALTAGAGATVSCLGTAVGLSLAGAVDGTYAVTVTPYDYLGNPGNPVTLTYVLDTTGPVAPAASSVTSPDNRRSVTWVLTATETGEGYACAVVGPGATVSCDPSGVTLSLIGAGDGAYVVTVTPIDALGNRGIPLVLAYTLDTTGPVQPQVMTAPPSPAVNRSIGWTVTDAESPVTYRCQQSGPVSFGLTCGTSIVLSLPAAAPDGVYTVTVTAYDALANAGVPLVLTYVLDTTPPVAPVVSIVSPGNDVTPTPVVTAEPGASLTCAIQRYFLPMATVGCGTDGTVDLSAFGDGEYEISVMATDAAGNVSAASTPYVYLLDTIAPATPVLTSPASPSPIENPVWRWTAEIGTTATCTVTSANGAVVAGPSACSDIYAGQFTSLSDGLYTLSIVLRDDAGNLSKPATSLFILDRTAPVPPTVVPPVSPDNSTAPRWLITTPRGATLTCTLSRGRALIMGPGACPADGVVSLVGMPDGSYTLRVTATDSAGNVSAASITTYVLDTVAPSAPSLAYGSPSAGSSRTPFWGFTLPAGATGRCELIQGGTVIASRANCRGAVSFTLNGADGFYAVRIVAVDAAGNTSNPLVVGYQLYGHGGGGAAGGSGGGAGGSSVGVGGGSGGGGRRPPRVPSSAPSAGTVQSLIEHLGAVAGQAGKTVRRAAGGVASVVPSLPVIHDPLTDNVSHAVQHVINAVSKAGGGTGFPLLLLIVVGVFLMAQSRVDRRDPKLALASVAADDHLQFGPPPSRGDA